MFPSSVCADCLHLDRFFLFFFYAAFEVSFLLAFNRPSPWLPFKFCLDSASCHLIFFSCLCTYLPVYLCALLSRLYILNSKYSYQANFLCTSSLYLISLFLAVFSSHAVMDRVHITSFLTPNLIKFDSFFQSQEVLFLFSFYSFFLFPVFTFFDFMITSFVSNNQDHILLLSIFDTCVYQTMSIQFFPFHFVMCSTCHVTHHSYRS